MDSSGKRGKSKNSTDTNGSLADHKASFASLEEKFVTWKKKSKPFTQYSFLNNLLFSDYLLQDSEPNDLKSSKKSGSSNKKKVTEVMKYIDIIKFVERSSNKQELDILYHNLSLVFGVDKRTIIDDVSEIERPQARIPKDMPTDKFLKKLLRKASITQSNGSDNGNESDESEGLDIETLKKKTNKKAQEKSSAPRMRSGEQKPQEAKKKPKPKEDRKQSLEEIETDSILKKKAKKESDDKLALSQLFGDDKKKIKKEPPKPPKEVHKESKRDVVKENKKKLHGDVINLKVEEDEIQEQESPTDAQYAELQINNDVDSDDGEGFSFFYVKENIYNKTKHYFEKAKKPEDCCSCVGGCNDPSICPCARYNFDNSGKPHCYIYDNKHQRKKLIPYFAKKDLHIYECSPECACNKGLCLNSCVNEIEKNRVELKDMIVERFEKKYLGDDADLKGVSAKMWGLKTLVPIPANSYVIEYCGEIISKKEGDRRGEKYDSVNCNYLFDLNKHVEIEKVDESTNMILLNVDGVCETRSIKKLKDISENFPLCIDAFFYGNHSRFVNHSCDPNLVAQPVHVENRNVFLPRVIFFAKRDIEAGEELTINYNCAPLKSLAHTNKLVCLCGAEQCKGYVYEEGDESDKEDEK